MQIGAKVKMVKLTVDLIEGAGQYINPIRDRELDLRFDFFISLLSHVDTSFDQRLQDTSDREFGNNHGPVRLHRLQ